MADRLYRSQTDRVVAGSLAASPRWPNRPVDRSRRVGRAGRLRGGIFLLVYIVMMIVVPLRAGRVVPSPARRAGRVRRRTRASRGPPAPMGTPASDGPAAECRRRAVGRSPPPVDRRQPGLASSPIGLAGRRHRQRPGPRGSGAGCAQTPGDHRVRGPAARHGMASSTVRAPTHRWRRGRRRATNGPPRERDRTRCDGLAARRTEGNALRAPNRPP